MSSGRPSRSARLSAVLAAGAAVVMVCGRVVPVLREAPVVVWGTALTLLVLAAVAAVRRRRTGRER